MKFHTKSVGKPRNYFDYFPVAPRLQPWGTVATSFGQVSIAPGGEYPPVRHPGRHHLGWERGRTLAEYQILFIGEGTGVFESALTRARRIEGGMVFVLFPGVWHRYRPDPATGWRESWLEIKGPHFDRLRRSRIIDPHRPLYRRPPIREIEPIFEKAATLARFKPPGFTVRLGLLAAEIFALLRWSSPCRRGAPRRIDALLSQGQAILAADTADQSSVEQVAQKLGLGYSYFRRQFKAQTGFSPQQYRIEMRLHRAKNLLLNSALTIKEISEQLGYSSPFHLSQEFSRRTGVSPQRWRMQR